MYCLFLDLNHTNSRCFISCIFQKKWRQLYLTIYLCIVKIVHALFLKVETATLTTLRTTCNERAWLWRICLYSIVLRLPPIPILLHSKWHVDEDGHSSKKYLFIRLLLSKVSFGKYRTRQKASRLNNKREIHCANWKSIYRTRVKSFTASGWPLRERSKRD